MKRVIPLAAILCYIFVGPSAMAVEPLVGYDGFNSRLINPAKWFGFDSDERLSTAESMRTVQPNRVLGNRLHLMIRGYGKTDSDTGTANGANRLRFDNGNAVTSLRAKVWVTGYGVTGSSINSTPSFVKARVAGFFFNTGAPTPGSAVNDVLAQVYVRRRSNSTDNGDLLEVKASLYQCADASCNTGTTLNSADLGWAVLGKPVVLLLEWDQANHQFLVQRDADAMVALGYTVADTSPPSLDNNKRLEVEYAAANGTVLPRSQGYINAYFDNVFVNQSAAP